MMRAGLIVAVVAAELASCAAPPRPPVALRVEANYPGANAKVVADVVAAPIEQQINGVEGALYLMSRSKNDGSYVLTVAFPAGTDLDAAQVLVQNRVNIALPTLPEVVKREGVAVRKAGPGESFPPLRPGRTAVLVNPAGEPYPRAAARALAKAVDAVAEDAEDVTTLVTDVDRVACTRLKLRPADVFEAVRLLGDAESFGKLKVRNADGKMVPAGAVATVKQVEAPRELLRYNLEPAARLHVQPGEGRGAVEVALMKLPAPRPRLVWPGDR